VRVSAWSLQQGIPARSTAFADGTKAMMGLTVTELSFGDSGTKTCRRYVYLFRLEMSFMTKIEIEGKCCHGYSNQELMVNVTMAIQMREEFETMNK
jgi:hypothetical protein